MKVMVIKPGRKLIEIKFIINLSKNRVKYRFLATKWHCNINDNTGILTILLLSFFQILNVQFLKT